MIMFMDVETTGLPKNEHAPLTDFENWPRIIQIGWLVTDLNGVDQHNGIFLIKPDGWVIPQEEFWVKHGFFTEKNEREGIPIDAALRPFITHLQPCMYMVSHNMAFDYKIIAAEMLRAQLKSERKALRICTKEASTNYCQIPFANRKQYPGMRPQQWKWPKLSQLHQKLFGTDFEGAHDAMADVYAVKKCFFELVRRGIIQVGPQPIPQ